MESFQKLQLSPLVPWQFVFYAIKSTSEIQNHAITCEMKKEAVCLCCLFHFWAVSLKGGLNNGLIYHSV